MSAFGWAYLAGAVLTLVATLWLQWPRRGLAESVALLVVVALWPVAWLIAAVEALGDIDV